MLMSDEEKHKKWQSLGSKCFFSPDFAEFKGMSPEDFVKKVLKERLNCSGAVCGNDFTFGKGAQGKAMIQSILFGDLPASENLEIVVQELFG